MALIASISIGRKNSFRISMFHVLDAPSIRSHTLCGGLSLMLHRGRAKPGLGSQFVSQIVVVSPEPILFTIPCFSTSLPSTIAL